MTRVITRSQSTPTVRAKSSMEVGVVVVTRFFFGHPARLGGAAVALVVAAGLAWYLGSPLFVRTYTSETLRAAAPAAVAPGVLAQGELRYVDSVHYGKGPVRIVELEGRRIVRFDGVAITNAPDIHVYLSRDRREVERVDEDVTRSAESE